MADATTDSSQPMVNAGSSTRLDFGKNNSPTAASAWFLRGHVQFDLTPFLGSGLVPTRAVFFWYQDQSNAAGCLDVSLHRLTAPWTEATVTWQNQPSYDPVEETRTCVGNSFALG